MPRSTVSGSKGRALNHEPCRHCTKNIIYKHDVPRHNKTHANDVEDLKFPCPKCTHKTLQKSNLAKHAYSLHGILIMYFCDTLGCTCSTTDINTFKNHKNDIHGVVDDCEPVPYECKQKRRRIALEVDETSTVGSDVRKAKRFRTAEAHEISTVGPDVRKPKRRRTAKAHEVSTVGSDVHENKSTFALPAYSQGRCVEDLPSLYYPATAVPPDAAHRQATNADYQQGGYVLWNSVNSLAFQAWGQSGQWQMPAAAYPMAYNPYYPGVAQNTWASQSAALPQVLNPALYASSPVHSEPSSQLNASPQAAAAAASPYPVFEGETTSSFLPSTQFADIGAFDPMCSLLTDVMPSTWNYTPNIDPMPASLPPSFTLDSEIDFSEFY